MKSNEAAYQAREKRLTDAIALRRPDRVPVAQRAYEASGLGPEDMGIYQAYGACPVVNLMFLNSLGFTEPGTTGAQMASGKGLTC